MDTRKKILEKALEMFNERGIEYVGLRELASILNMRVSNITYYFPTKDDLVYELSLELKKANAALLVERENLTLLDFLEMLHAVFQNHIRFRSLLLSVVHLVMQNKHLAAEYKKTQNSRNATLKSNLKALATAGYFKITNETDLEFLVSAISLISRFWISESSISFREAEPGDQVKYYLFLVTKLLTPYSEQKGLKEMEIFISSH